LEVVCDEFIRNKYESVTGAVATGLDSVASYVADKFVKKASSVPEVKPCRSERDGEAFNISFIDGDGEVTRVDIKTGEFISNPDKAPDTTELHRAIYKKRKDVNFIVHTKTPDVVAVSKLGRTMKPLLDDFAQLCGATVRHAAFDANNTLKTSKKVVKALKGRNAVLLDNNGALCVSSSEYDATAVEIVMDKGARTEVGARLFDIVKPINPIETRLMRFIYLKKYSKQAKD
jgi:L-fuculose-phosphate aldolase